MLEDLLVKARKKAEKGAKESPVGTLDDSELVVGPKSYLILDGMIDDLSDGDKQKLVNEL